MMSVQDVFEDAGYECRSYSGRAMYGATCLAVELESGVDLGTFIASVIDSLSNLDREEDGHQDVFEDVAQAFRQMREDQMGLGQVVYFPGTAYFADDSEIHEDDEDDEELVEQSLAD